MEGGEARTTQIAAVRCVHVVRPRLAAAWTLRFVHLGLLLLPEEKAAWECFISSSGEEALNGGLRGPMQCYELVEYYVQ